MIVWLDAFTALCPYRTCSPPTSGRWWCSCKTDGQSSNFKQAWELPGLSGAGNLRAQARDFGGFPPSHSSSIVLSSTTRLVNLELEAIPITDSGVRWDRALGSETGRRTDHVTPSNSEPKRCSSSALPFLLSLYPILLHLHSCCLRLSFRAPTPRRHPPPSTSLIFPRVPPPPPRPRPPSPPCDTAAAALILLTSRSLARTPCRLSLSFPLSPSPRRALSRSRAANATDTPRRCLSPAARAHVIRAPQPPLRRRRWTLDFTYFVVTSA